MDFKTYPVIVFMEGEMFTIGYPGNYPAEDLAAEGLVVVSIHYRLNIFGKKNVPNSFGFIRTRFIQIKSN